VSVPSVPGFLVTWVLFSHYLPKPVALVTYPAMAQLTFSAQIGIFIFVPLLAATMLAFLTAVISNRTATKNARAQNDVAERNAKAQIETAAALKLSDFRQAWINDLRDCISKLQTKSLVHKDEPSRENSEIERLAYKIRLLMNPTDPNYAALASHIASLVEDGDYDTVNSVTSLAHTILKTEWEVLKRDLKYEQVAGNANRSNGVAPSGQDCESDAGKQTKPMADIIDNDIRKIHAEVTQIVNQRFQLTTLAILVVATVAGWAATIVGKSGSLDTGMVTALTFLVTLILLMIFAYFMLLLGMMRIWTVYLQEKSWSQFEGEWSIYRKERTSREYLGYTKAGTIIFVLLGPLAFGYFIVISWLSGAFHWRPLLCLPIVWVSVYVVSVLGAGWARHKLIDEGAIRRNWQVAIQKGQEH
jgi:hypothetical protein